MIQSKIFQQVIDSYVKEKRSLGFKYNTEANMLRRVVTLQIQIDKGAPILSKKTVLTWTEKTSWESESTRGHRISLIRCLGKYMTRMDLKAYIVPDKFAPVQSYTYIPYIFSDRELGAILTGVEIYFKKSISQHASLVFPLVSFR
jgi:hypothetical protein